MIRFVQAICLLSVFALSGCPSTAPSKDAPGEAAEGTPSAGLLDPSAAAQTAPDSFVIRFETTGGTFRVQVTKAWSPNGADRVFSLVKAGYYDGCHFYRVISNPPFMAQFGINGNPDVNAAWIEATIPDDPVTQSNTRGKVTFAMTGLPNSRTTQLFVNYKNNSNLDSMGFAPFGEVIEGMDVVDGLFGGYGEGAPRGRGPDQGRAQAEGNAYFDAEFPKLDAIKQATIE